MSRMTGSSASSATSRHQHLDSALDARERIAHLVGDDGGHLPDAGESGLLCQAFLGCLASGDVGADGYIDTASRGCPGTARWSCPPSSNALGAIAQFAVPDLTVRDRPPQAADELFGVIGGVDDAMVLPDQFLARIARNFHELVVDVGDPARHVGRGHDRGTIKGTFEVGELLNMIRPAVVRGRLRIVHRVTRW